MEPFGKKNDNQNIRKIQKFSRVLIPFLLPRICGEKDVSSITIPQVVTLLRQFLKEILNKPICRLIYFFQ
jgi:hypothetical protein